MNLKLFDSMAQIFLAIAVALMLIVTGCSSKPEPEELPMSVAANLNYLQENPQFVMYLNFKSMRRTDFWKKNISDSLLNAEKTFGSILNTFKIATGTSVSEGLDELYYSNSWFGENAIVLKGVFNRTSLNNYLSTDSIFSITKSPEGHDIYIKNDNGLYFFFMDDYTICASNYLKQIDAMMHVKDTAKSGLMLNSKVYDAVKEIIYKEDLWMISTERFFIRGIFQNFLQSTTGSDLPDDSTQNSNPEVLNDSAEADTKPSIENLYTKLNSVSFSAKMSSDLKLMIQGSCINEDAAKYLRSILSGVITVAKLSSAARQEKIPNSILDNLKPERYSETVFIEMTVNESNLQDLKKTDILIPPN